MCLPARRLAVGELKADEDIHLPLQALDYWPRVEWHHAAASFFASAISVERNFPQKTAAISGGAGAARASGDRHMVAIHLARDGMGVRGN
jgi:hypothetical protein